MYKISEYIHSDNSVKVKIDEPTLNRIRQDLFYHLYVSEEDADVVNYMYDGYIKERDVAYLLPRLGNRYITVIRGIDLLYFDGMVMHIDDDMLENLIDHDVTELILDIEPVAY